MALNITSIRARIAANSGEKKKVNPHIFKPVEGEQIIRIVPRKGFPEEPFQELYFYYKLVPGKTYLSPLSFDKPDPIKEFGDSCLSGARVSKDEYRHIKQTYSPVVRTYVPVIVRGKESEGVKWYAFGKTIMEKLVAIIEDEDYGDITDIEKGFDLKLTFVPGDGKTDFGSADIVARRNPSPLTTDKALLKKLLNDQVDLLTAVDYPQYTYEELSTILKNSLKGPGEEPETPPSAMELATETPTLTKSATSSKELTDSVADEFDALFADES